MTDPISVGLIIMTSVLVFERLTKYYFDHVKKSKCWGGEIEFKSNESIKKIESNEIHRILPITPPQQRRRATSNPSPLIKVDPNVY
jgi:hypothetical protein